jgi:hypothetical protein
MVVSSDDLTGRNLIFLISQPRAGSTLLQRILAGHPEVHTVAEPWLMLHPIYALRATGHSADYDAALAYQALAEFLDTFHDGRRVYFEAIRKMALHLYDKACEEARKSYFLDKTPRYALIIRELIEIFPEAHYIFLLRNPLAVLASILDTWVRGNWPHMYQHHDDLVQAPRHMVSAIHQLGSQAVRVQYEDLVIDPVRQVRCVCEHLGLEFDRSMLEYGARPAPPGRFGDPAGIKRHSRPSTESLDRWLSMGEWRQTRHLAQEYLRILSPGVLHELGYDADELIAKILAIELKRRGIIASWKRIFPQRMTLVNKLFLIMITSIQQRHPRQSARRVIEALADYL